MTVTPESAAATIVFLAPGFVLLSVFYWFGLQVKRSDAQWLIWSLIASAAINPAASKLGIDRTIAAFGLAIVGGGLLALAWNRVPRLRFIPGRIRRRLLSFRQSSGIRAWDNVMERAAWLQVEISDGRTYFGLMSWAAKSVDTDDLDLYLVRASQIVEGKRIPIQAHGILIQRSSIRLISPFVWSRLPAPSTGAPQEVRSGHRHKGKSRGASVLLAVRGLLRSLALAAISSETSKPRIAQVIGTLVALVTATVVYFRILHGTFDDPFVFVPAGIVVAFGAYSMTTELIRDRLPAPTSVSGWRLVIGLTGSAVAVVFSICTAAAASSKESLARLPVDQVFFSVVPVAITALVVLASGWLAGRVTSLARWRPRGS